MSIWKFQSSLNANGTVTLPPDVVAHLQPDQEIRVVIVAGEDDEDEDADWKRFAAEQFLNGYGPGDEIYDNL